MASTLSAQGAQLALLGSIASPAKPTKLRQLSVRCSNAEGPRRPVTPAPTVEGSSSSPAVATAPTPPTTTSTTERPASTSKSSASGVTIEFQRQRAKEMVAYFEDKKFERQVEAGRAFGWTRKNEIANGRWSMFGLAVGLLTEFATGVNFPEQLKIIISNLGILDLD